MVAVLVVCLCFQFLWVQVLVPFFLMPDEDCGTAGVLALFSHFIFCLNEHRASE